MAAALAIGGGGLLIRNGSRVDRWLVDSDQAAPVLTLQADAAVRGWTRSSFPHLILQCMGTMSVVVMTGLPLEVEAGDTRSVLIAFDDEAASMRRWTVSADRQMLTPTQEELAELTNRLANSLTFAVTFVPLHAEPVTARFSLFGLPAHRAVLGPACG